MTDRREEILIQEHDKLVDDHGYPKDGSKLLLTYRPAALFAMDEYMKEVALELIDFMHENDVEFGYELGEKRYLWKGEWISKEQLFENFL